MADLRIAKAVTILFRIIVSVAVFIFVYQVVSKIKFRTGEGSNQELTVTIRLKTLHTQEIQLFYNHAEGFIPDRSLTRLVAGKSSFQEIPFTIRKCQGISRLRLDPGKSTDTLFVETVTISNRQSRTVLDAATLDSLFTNRHECNAGMASGLFWMRSLGSDPYVTSSADLAFLFDPLLNRKKDPFIAAVFALLTAVFIFLCLHFYNPPEGKVNFRYISSWFLIVSFSFLLVMPLFMQRLPIQPEDENAEKRFKASFPELTADALAGFPEDFSAYFNDHFGGRTYWIRAYSYLKAKVFSVSAMPGQVMIGKAGWLFYADENTPGYYRNENLFTNAELETIRINLQERADWCRLHQARFYLLLPPMASSIYPEFLPDHIRKVNAISCLDQVVEYLKANGPEISLVDLREQFRKERKKRMIYYQTDFHWNMTGAFLAYRSLAEAINSDTLLCRIPKEEEFTTTVVTTYDADLAGLLNLQKYYPRDLVVMIPNTPERSKIGEPTQYPGQELFKQDPVVYVSDSSGLSSMVMFRDSYSNYLMPFLSEHFSRSCYIWTNHFIPEIIEMEMPSVVVQEVVEKFIRDLLLGNPPSMKQDILQAVGKSGFNPSEVGQKQKEN